MKKSLWLAALAAVWSAGTLTAQETRIEVGEDGAAEARVDTAAGDRFYRATELIGTVVKDDAGQPIGQVKDLMIDGSSEQVRYLILNGNETLGTRSDFVVLPWSVVQTQYAAAPDQRFITVRNFGIDRLRQAPTISEAQLRQFDRVDWASDVNRFYNVSVRGQRDGIDGRSRNELQTRDREGIESRRDRRNIERRDGDGAAEELNEDTRRRLDNARRRLDRERPDEDGQSDVPRRPGSNLPNKSDDRPAPPAGEATPDRDTRGSTDVDSGRGSRPAGTRKGPNPASDSSGGASTSGSGAARGN